MMKWLFEIYRHAEGYTIILSWIVTPLAFAAGYLFLKRRLSVGGEVANKDANPEKVDTSAASQKVVTDSVTAIAEEAQAHTEAQLTSELSENPEGAEHEMVENEGAVATEATEQPSGAEEAQIGEESPSEQEAA